MGNKPIDELVFERRMVWELALARMHRRGGTLRECIEWAVGELAAWQGSPNVRVEVPMEVFKRRPNTFVLTPVVVDVVLDLTVPIREGAGDEESAATAHDFSSVPFVEVRRFRPEDAPPPRSLKASDARRK